MFRLNEQPQTILQRISSPDDKKKFMTGVLMDPLRFHCPNGAQERYIQTVAHSTEKTKIPVILPTFANGVGKSTETLIIVLNFILGPQNGWFDYPIFRNFPFPKTIWYCSTNSAIQNVILPYIEKFCAPDIHPERRFHLDKKYMRLTFPRQGWAMSLKTYDQGAEKYESENVGIIVKDEPSPEPLWKASKSRRRMGCITLMPMTPLYTAPYILDEIKRAADENRTGYYHLKATVYDACKKRGIRGHLDPDIVDDMVAGYDQDEREARAYGEFMYYSTQIYNLDRSIHFIPSNKFPIPQYSKYLQVVDPHDSRPSASIYAAKTPDKFDRYIIYNETPLEKNQQFWDMKRTQTVEEEIQMWDRLEKELSREPDVRILDRNFGWQLRGQRNFAQMYKKAGIDIHKDFRFLSSYKAPGSEVEVEYGHRRVRKLLKIQPDGLPGLMIYDNCKHTWEGLTHYIRKRLTGKGAEDQIQQDARIVDKYKDFPDCVRYLACSDLVKTEIPAKPKTEAQKLRELATRTRKGRRNEFEG